MLERYRLEIRQLLAARHDLPKFSRIAIDFHFQELYIFFHQDKDARINIPIFSADDGQEIIRHHFPYNAFTASAVFDMQDYIHRIALLRA